MNAYVHFEVSLVDRAIRAYAPIGGQGSSNLMMLFGYGHADPWTTTHRREYTTVDARALCEWLNQRVEYLQNLRFPSPVHLLGPELGSEATSAIDPPDGERGMASASICGADALGDTEIVLTERELMEAMLLTDRETF
jgi:hypothetical protein